MSSSQSDPSSDICSLPSSLLSLQSTGSVVIPVTDSHDHHSSICPSQDTLKVVNRPNFEVSRLSPDKVLSSSQMDSSSDNCLLDTVSFMPCIDSIAISRLESQKPTIDPDLFQQESSVTLDPSRPNTRQIDNLSLKTCVSIPLVNTIAEESFVQYDQPISKLAINATLLYRFGKSPESIEQLLRLCNKFENQRVYFFTSDTKQGCEKVTSFEITSILAEFGIHQFRILRTYGQDKECFNKERITHLIDNRPKQLSKMQTVEGYIRRCYCICSNKLEYPGLFMFSTWTDAASKVLQDIDDKIPLKKYDYTYCVSCKDVLCGGECHITREQLYTLNPDFENRDSTLVVVSWNVRSLRKCYLDGFFLQFLKQTDADLLFLQEVSAAPYTILSLPGFSIMLKEYGFEYTYWFPCRDKPHYSGTALFSRFKPDIVIKGFLGKVNQTPNLEGRIITAILGSTVWIGAYVPTLTLRTINSDGNAQRRIDFHDEFAKHLENEMFKDKHIVICGDLNTTRYDTDLRCWKKIPFPQDFPSTSYMERDFLQKVLVQHKLVDAAEFKNDLRFTFKGSHLMYPGLQMRLDYFLVPQSWTSIDSSNNHEQIINVSGFQVLTQYAGSDHCPIRLETTSRIQKILGPPQVERFQVEGDFMSCLSQCEQPQVESDSVRTRCWSVTRKDKQFICYNGKECKYSHICICDNMSCLGNCQAMKDYQSIPKSRKFRKLYLKTLFTPFNPSKEVEDFSHLDVCVSQAMNDLPLLLEKTSINDPSKTLVHDITLIMQELGLSAKTLSINSILPVKKHPDVKIEDVTYEDLNLQQDVQSNLASDSVMEIVLPDYPQSDAKNIAPEDFNLQQDSHCDLAKDGVPDKSRAIEKTHSDLDLIFNNFDPDNFNISQDLIMAILKIDSKPRSQLHLAQQHLEQIKLFDDAQNKLGSKDERSHLQLRNEAWRAVQTLYYIYQEYADVTRLFVQSTRYCGEWENLTSDDLKQMEVYFYPVRNVMKAIKQLQITKVDADQILVKVFKHCHFPIDQQVYVEDSHSESCCEKDVADGELNIASRKTYCPHINIKIDGNSVSVNTLLDTGATYCIITRSYLKTILTDSEISQRQVSTNIKLQVANGQVTKPLKKINLTFNMGSEDDYKNDFYIMDSDASYKVILGCSFLENQGVQLNFKKQEMIIPSKSNLSSDNTSTFSSNPQGKIEADVIIPFTVMQTDLYRGAIPLHCSEEAIIEPYSEGIVYVQALNEESKKYDQKFGEVWSYVEHYSLLRGATGFNYLSQHRPQGYTVINPTADPIKIRKLQIVAEFYPTCAECYGSVFNIGDIGDETPPEPDPSVELKTNFATLGPDVIEGINMPPCVGRDYTIDGGFREIIPAEMIADYSEDQIRQMFLKMGLSDLALSPNKEKPKDCKLSEDLENLFFQMQAKRQQVYSKNNANPIPVKHYTVAIPWKGEPRQSGLRAYSPEMIDIYKKELNPFIEAGVLIPSKSPWRSAVMLVIKPDGKTWRMVTDFRLANKQVQKRNWPLPRIDAALTAIAGAKFFSSVDQNNCYFQLPLSDSRSRDWATIQTPLGVYSYTRCPQGYINSQADLMRFMDLYVLAGISWKCCLAYSDDCIIWSQTGEQHIRDIDSVLCRIEYFGIQLKASKCEFFMPQLLFLGHEISNAGIRPSPKKTSAIQLLPLPQTSKDLKGFCAKVGYYRHNMKNLAEKLSPLTDLERKNCSWPHEYTMVEKKAFEDVKKELCSEDTMLAVRDLQYKLAVDPDGSKHGVGAILIQLSKPERPIMYASRKLKESERLYHSYAIEVLAVVFGITVYRPWIIFEEFILRIDCVALRWLMTTDQSSMFIRWVMMICEYRFKILHRSGRLALHVDYISRNPIHEEGYYGEQSIEGLYCPITSKKHLVSKLDEAIEAHDIAKIMQLGPVNQYDSLTLPIGILDSEIFEVDQQLYLEIHTLTQRLVYQILNDGAHQQLVEIVRIHPREVVEIKYAELMNFIAHKTCSQETIGLSAGIQQTLYLGSVKPKPLLHVTKLKKPSVSLYTFTIKPDLPIIMEKLFCGLYPGSNWSSLTGHEQQLVSVYRLKQGLSPEILDMLELKTQGVFEILTKHPISSNVWLTSVSNDHSSIQPDTWQRSFENQILDPRLWNFAQYICVTPISKKVNCRISFSVANGITIHTIRDLLSYEPLSLSSLNVISIVIQLHDEIQAVYNTLIPHKECNTLIPYVKPISMYADTSWDLLTAVEKNDVLLSEIKNINQHVSDVQVIKCKNPQTEYGVFAVKFIGKRTILSTYEGEELSTIQVEARYPNVNDSVYLFEKKLGFFVDAVDPRKSNFTRFINCPGVGERPNCEAVYNIQTKKLDLRTLRILVPEEELTISYGPKYHFIKDRVRTENDQVRKKFALRGRRNENMSDLNSNPPLRVNVENVEDKNESSEEEIEHPSDNYEDPQQVLSVEDKVKQIMIRITNIEENLLKMVTCIHKMLMGMNESIKCVTDQTKQLIHSAVNKPPLACQLQPSEESLKTNKRLLQDDEKWLPQVLKKPRLEMFDSNGVELPDELVQEALFDRQKVKIYHHLEKTLPQLFIDPNEHQPKKQFQINDQELRVDDGLDPFVQTELINDHVIDKSTPLLSYYFPNLSQTAIKDVQKQLHSKRIFQIDDMVKHVEDELIGNKTTDLFRKWNCEDKTVQSVVKILNQHASGKVIELSEKPTSSAWVIKNYRYDDGLLWRINHSQPTRHGVNTQRTQKESLYVPDKVGLRETILRYYHGTVAGSHPGSNELQYRIRIRYYWPHVRKNCVAWVKGCDLCANRKLPRPVHSGLSYPNFNTQLMWPMSCVLVDFIHGLPDCGDGDTCLCTIYCQFSRYPWAFACDGEDTDNAVESLKIAFCSTPFPIGMLISDKGCGFTSKVMKKLCQDLDIRSKQTSTQSPVGGIEIFNKYFMACLSLLILKPERRYKWKRYVSPVLYYFRSSTGTSGYSPFQMLYGFNPPNPIDILFDVTRPDEYKIHDSAFRKEMAEIYCCVRKIRQRATVLQTIYKNLGQKFVKYEPDDLVRIWIKTSKVDRFYTVGRVVEHPENAGFARVKVMKYGKWQTEHIRISNIAPYTPYTDEYFTSAPEKYSITEEPPQIVQQDLEQKLPETKSVPKLVAQELTCQVGNFVVIPADLWVDIETDRLPYSIAKCLSVYKEDNLTFGIFQRYGNLHGKMGTTRQQKPGFIDRRDKKYFYTITPKSQSIPYSNDLTKLGLPKVPIRLTKIPIVFPGLHRHCVPAETQKLIDELFPEVLQYRDKQVGKNVFSSFKNLSL